MGRFPLEVIGKKEMSSKTICEQNEEVELFYILLSWRSCTVSIFNVMCVISTVLPVNKIIIMYVLISLSN